MAAIQPVPSNQSASKTSVSKPTQTANPSTQVTYFPESFTGSDLLYMAKLQDSEQSTLKGKYRIVKEFNTRLYDLEHIYDMDYEAEITPILEELAEKMIKINLENIQYAADGKSARVLLTDGREITVHKPRALEMAEIEEITQGIDPRKMYSQQMAIFKIIQVTTRKAINLVNIKELKAEDINTLGFAQAEMLPKE